MKNVESIVFFLVLGSLLLAALGGIIDIFERGITKEHMWHDSILLMLLALLLVQTV